MDNSVCLSIGWKERVWRDGFCSENILLRLLCSMDFVHMYQEFYIPVCDIVIKPGVSDIPINVDLSLGRKIAKTAWFIYMYISEIQRLILFSGL